MFKRQKTSLKVIKNFHVNILRLSLAALISSLYLWPYVFNVSFMNMNYALNYTIKESRFN